MKVLVTGCVSSPDDLFRHGVDFDFKKLGYQPLLFNYDDALVAGTSNRD